MPDESIPPLNDRFTVNIDSSRPGCSRRDVAIVMIKGMCSDRAVTRTARLLNLLGLCSREQASHRVELRRALYSDRFFFDWHRANLRRMVDLRTVTISQLDRHGDDTINRWRLFDCWIHTWRGPDFDAMNADVAYETITLCYRSISWLTNSDPR
jgi:phage tail-like protein